MEVILKKTKITKSIIDQSLRGPYSLYFNWTGYDILGWVGIKRSKEYYRWTLFYKNDTNQIIKIPYIDNSNRIKYFEKGVQLPDAKMGYIYPQLKHIEVTYPDSFSGFIFKQDYPVETEEEMDLKFEAIKNHITEVNQKGQIYI